MAPQELRLVLGQVGEDGQVKAREGMEEIASATLQRCAQNERGLHLLDISNTAFTASFLAEFAQAMCHNTVLQEVYLDNCQISDEGVRMLAQGLSRNLRHDLKALSLEDNLIHCRGASFLARMLQQRGFRWASSRRSGGLAAPSCGRGSGLRYLSLKGNAVADVGAKALAEVLIQSDNSLETLNLEGNRISDGSAGWLAMALRNHRVLRCLNVCGNPITCEGLRELQGGCERAEALLVVTKTTTCPSEEQLQELLDRHRKAAVYVSEAKLAAINSAVSPARCSSASAKKRPTSACFRTSGRARDKSTARGKVKSGPLRPGSFYDTQNFQPALKCTSEGDNINEVEVPPPAGSPNRWRRKPRGALDLHGNRVSSRPASAQVGCGAAAARELRRSSSAPGSSVLLGHPASWIASGLSGNSGAEAVGAVVES